MTERQAIRVRFLGIRRLIQENQQDDSEIRIEVSSSLGDFPWSARMKVRVPTEETKKASQQYPYGVASFARLAFQTVRKVDFHPGVGENTQIDYE